MPRSQQHLQKAAHNEAFVVSLGLSTSPYLDWAVTGMFYSAVHYVEAYLATQGIHSVDHRARDSDIQRKPQLKSLYVPYNELKNHSINARYMTTRFTAADVVGLQPELDIIKRHILQLLPRP